MKSPPEYSGGKSRGSSPSVPAGRAPTSVPTFVAGRATPQAPNRAPPVAQMPDGAFVGGNYGTEHVGHVAGGQAQQVQANGRGNNCGSKDQPAFTPGKPSNNASRRRGW